MVVIDRPPTSWRRLEEICDFAESQIRWLLRECLVDFWHNTWYFDKPLAWITDIFEKPHAFVGEFYVSNGWNEQQFH